MKPVFLAAAGLALLAAPAAAQNAPHAPYAPYRAIGTEPFWGLTIDARAMRFEAPGRLAVSAATPRVIRGFAGETYRTPRIAVNIVHRPCSDGMSDRRYPDTVSVTVDGRSYRGCGGLQPEAPLAGEWRALTVAGKPVVRGTRVTIAFQEGRASGSTGCNRFSGRYGYGRGTLTLGPLATTKRACLGSDAGRQEQKLLALLGKPLRVQVAQNGRLVLRGTRGQTIVLARAPAPR